MPRRPRIHIPGAFYHVTLRGNHRQAIFFSQGDRRLLREIVTESIARFPARVHAYCWMTNHVHMLVQAGDIPIGRLILRVASRYARIVQSRVPTTGHLFERRYHAVLVDADRYLLALLRYIHLNPVRAGMVRSADDYEWSSHRAYTGVVQEPWLTTDFVLGLWSVDRNSASTRYRDFMHQSDGQASGSPWDNINWRDPRVLGDDEFLQRMCPSSETADSNQALDGLVAEACHNLHIDIEELLSTRRNQRLVRARSWIAREALDRQVGNTSQVARRLNRSESSIRELLLRHYPPGPK